MIRYQVELIDGYGRIEVAESVEEITAKYENCKNLVAIRDLDARTDGITKTKSGWLIDVDLYTGRDRYYTGTIAGQIIRTTEDPTIMYNKWYPTVADLIIGCLHDGHLPKSCTYYRK